MSQNRNAIFLAIAMGIVMLFTLPGSIIAEDYDDDDVCFRVRAKIKTAVVQEVEECGTEIGICTAGKIFRGGLLNGTTFYVVESVGPGAGVGLDPAEVLSYAGELTITTRHGTLFTRDLGVVDYAEGVFSEYDIVTGGTGIFEGATGKLFIFGSATPESFRGKIEGEICLAAEIDD